jgi:hypothetical protein
MQRSLAIQFVVVVGGGYTLCMLVWVPDELETMLLKPGRIRESQHRPMK